MRKAFAFVLPLALLTQASVAVAQTPTGPIAPLAPPPGAPKSSKIPIVSDSDRNKLLSRDSLGRPCLQITAESRSQLATPNIFDHIVIANNRCLQRIKVKLCYPKSDRCFLVEVSGNQRKETILGTFPAQRDFRYEYQEQR